MPRLDQRGVAHLLLPLILIAGILVGVYLITSGNPLKLFSKASNPPIVFKSSTGQSLPKDPKNPLVTTTTSSSVKIEFTSTLGAPVGIGSTASVSSPTKVGTVGYRFAENPTDLNTASYQPYRNEPTIVGYTFRDSNPGQKFIWVEFLASDGRTDRRSAQINILPSLVSYWRLDETSGSKVADVKGVRNGSATDQATIITAGQKLGAAARQFQGTGIIAIPRAQSTMSNLTVSAWIKTGGIGTQGILNQDEQTRIFQFRYDNAYIRLIVFDTSGKNYQCLGKKWVRDATAWHHVVGSWDGSVEKIYVDGVLDNSCPTPNASLKQGNVTTFIGGYNNTGRLTGGENFMRGSIDEVGLWSKALTATEVAQLYNSGNGQDPTSTTCPGSCGGANREGLDSSLNWDWKPEFDAWCKTNASQWHCFVGSPKQSTAPAQPVTCPGTCADENGKIGNKTCTGWLSQYDSWCKANASQWHCFNSCTIPPTPTTSPTPLTSKRVFVTSITYNGNLGGLSGADAKCQDRANAVSLGGTWKAWLSDNTSSPSNRFNKNNGPYKTLNNTTIADNWSDLTAGSIKTRISITELKTERLSPWGQTTDEAVWTNTSKSGDVATTRDNYNCQKWTASEGANFGIYGYWSTRTSSWSNNEFSYACNATLPLYCFEQ